MGGRFDKSPRAEWTSWTAVVVGLTFGLAILTKLNAVVIAPLLVYRVATLTDGGHGSRPKLASITLVAALPGIALLFWRNLALYHSLIVVYPGVETNWSFITGHIVWAIRNLIWSFWLAFGRTYQITLPPVVYILTILPLTLGAAVGLARTPAVHRRLIVTGIGTTIFAVVASLIYTFSYPPGEMTSWGKNLYPVLPVIALLLALGWRYLTPRPSSLVPRVAITLLIIGDLWALLKLMELWGCV